MSTRTASLAKSNIKKHIDFLISISPETLLKSLTVTNISKVSIALLRSHKIRTFADLLAMLDNQSLVYAFEENNKKMTSISRGVARYRKKVEEKHKKGEAKSPTKGGGKPTAGQKQSGSSGKASRIKPIHTRAINKIHNSLFPLVKNNCREFLNRTLKEAGTSPYCYNYAYKKNLYTLFDIYNSLDNLIEIYNYVQGHLKNLSENIGKVCKNELRKIKANHCDEQVISKDHNKFSYQDFIKMAVWSKKSPVVKAIDNLLVTTKTGFQFYVGSTSEKTIFERFNKRGDVVDIRGQDLVIPYKGKGGDRSEYHPDLVILFKSGDICLYEVKPVIQMATHDVLVKYSAMIKYAKSKGYRCAMGGVSSKTATIITFDDIRKRKPDVKFKRYVERIINKNGVFEPQDVTNYKNKHHIVGNGATNKLFYDLASIVINDLDNHFMFSREGKSIHSWRIRRPLFPNKIKF